MKKNKPAKMHYAEYEDANESDTTEYFGEVLCGTFAINPTSTTDTKRVTCKKCLNKITITIQPATK